VLQSGNLYDINGGRVIGGVNQFHSFGQFSVGTGDIASFNGPAGIRNIVNRVTGGLGSNIDGTVASTIAGASLFLLNPAGIMFGPNAQLSVTGSFHASTGDYIKLGNDGVFYADPARASLLTVSPPSAFGFLTGNPGPIEINTGSLLAVPVGETLSFVGGTVNLGAADFSAPAYVAAPGGTLNLVSVASPGEATFNSPIHVDGFAQLGDINIKGGSVVDAKNVFIRGGKLVIDESVIFPGAFSSLLSAPAPDGGEVNIKVSGDVTITGTALEPVTQAPPGIFTFAGSFVTPEVFPSAKVPDITIEAGNGISLSGFAAVQTFRFGPGDPSVVSIKAKNVLVENGAGIALFNLFEGPGGRLTVEGERVEMSGLGTRGGAVGATGLLAQGLFHPDYLLGSINPALTNGDSGSITVRATGPGGLIVRDGAEIATDSLNFGRGADINVTTTNATLSGSGQVSAQSAFAGDSGNVKIQASGAIDIKDGFVISANTFGSGESGSVEVSANGPITISGIASGIASQTGSPPTATLDAFASLFLPGATFSDLALELGLPADADLFAVLDGLNALGLTAVTDLTPGNGGTITVATPILAVSGAGSAIDSGTAWAGNAGNVQVNVGSVAVNDGAEIRSRSGILNLETGNLDVGNGNAGAVNIVATDTISVSGTGSAISTTTFGDGNAGDISLSANHVNVQNIGSVSSATGGTVNGQLFVGGGNAGQIAVSTPTVTMSDGGTISVATAGAGNAGNVLLNVSNFSLTGGAQILSSTTGDGVGGTVAATASESVSISGLESGLFSTASSAGNAGQISVSTPTLTMAEGGTISVATSGAGNAGNISLNVNSLTQSGGAQVVSSTTGAGQGGSLIANAGESIAISGSGSQPSGLFSTASSTGNAGQIAVSTPSLTMADGGRISVATEGSGNAGNIALNVGNLTQTAGSTIDSSTAGAGQGGDVTVTAGNSVSLSGTGTGLFSTASGSGAGGNIHVQGGNFIQLADNATLSAQSTGTATATAGNISISTPTFEAQNASVTTAATLADGGNISIVTTGSMVHLTDSQITTSVESGVGSGGNIAIASSHIVLDDSRVLANAFGGPGGNINITGDVFLVNSGGQFPPSLAGIIQASSALSTPGTINIEATVTDVSSTVAQLPEVPLQATELLRAACAARFAGGKASSLVLGGRDGLPLQPGSLLPSPLYLADKPGSPTTTSSGFPPNSNFSLLRSSDWILNRYTLLPNFKCSL
jgi:filamentous hemagglutinin family protein